MGTLEVTHVIDAPRARVWDIFTDYPGWPVWTGVDAVCVLEHGRPAPYGVGCVREVLQGGLRVREQITEFERPRRLGGRIIGGVPLMRRYRSALALEAIEDGRRTRMVYRAEFELSVPLLGWALRGAFERSSARSVRAIYRDLDAYIRRLDR